MFLWLFGTLAGEGREKARVGAGASGAELRLVEGLERRDPEALRQVLDAHRDRIFTLARRITGSVEDAEEVTQDTFVRLLDKIGQFEGRSSLGTWLYRMGLNLALMKRRSSTRRPEQPWEDPMLAFTEDGHHAAPIRRWRGTVRDILKDETARVVREAVEALPEDYRTVVVLADLEGRSREEIAEMLELSVPAVKSRLHRARMTLRDRLADEFGEE